jgi:hypothetical protein
MACVFCRDRQFQAWIEHLAAQSGTAGEFDEECAKEFVLASCGIYSRNELDTNAGAAERFHELVRRPFLEWKEAQHAG